MSSCYDLFYGRLHYTDAGNAGRDNMSCCSIRGKDPLHLGDNGPFVVSYGRADSPRVHDDNNIVLNVHNISFSTSLTCKVR